MILSAFNNLRILVTARATYYTGLHKYDEKFDNVRKKKAKIIPVVPYRLFEGLYYDREATKQEATGKVLACSLCSHRSV